MWIDWSFARPDPFPGTGLDLVGDHDHPIVTQPRHALDRTVDGPTAGVGREPEDGSLVGDLVDEVRAVSAQAADPQRRGRLRHHREPVTDERDAAVVLELERARQPDGAGVDPAAARTRLGEHLDPAAARPSSRRPAPAPVALAHGQQTGPAVAAQAGQPLQALVRVGQREVQPVAAQVAQGTVELVHLGLVGPRPDRQRLDQREEPIGAGIVGDVLEARGLAALLGEDAVLGRAGDQTRTQPDDVGQVVEDDVEAVVLREHAAGLQPPAGGSVERLDQLDQLRLALEAKLDARAGAPPRSGPRGQWLERSGEVRAPGACGRSRRSRASCSRARSRRMRT